MTLIGQSGINPGDVWVLIGALFYGLSIAYIGEVANKVSSLALVQVQFAVMTLVMTLWALPHLSTIPTLNLNSWLVLIYLGVICMSLPFVLQVWAQRVVPPYLTALLFILEPVFASLLAFVILGERLSGLDWLGATLIIAALFVCTLPLKTVSKRAALVSEVEQERS
jgi:drug/metabolite transporter (DMT)-like permease